LAKYGRLEWDVVARTFDPGSVLAQGSRVWHILVLVQSGIISQVSIADMFNPISGYYLLGVGIKIYAMNYQPPSNTQDFTGGDPANEMTVTVL